MTKSLSANKKRIYYASTLHGIQTMPFKARSTVASQDGYTPISAATREAALTGAQTIRSLTPHPFPRRLLSVQAVSKRTKYLEN